MKIIYTRQQFASMPKREKISIIKAGGLFQIPGPDFWQKLTEFKNKFNKKTA